MRRPPLSALLLLLLCVVTAPAGFAQLAQEPVEAPGEEDSTPAWAERCIEEFQRNTEIADWLLEYDRQAWESSDVVFQQPQEVLAKLTTEWFCRPREDRWSCYYGRFDAARSEYEVVVQLERNDAGELVVQEEVDRDPGLAARARAIRGALERMPAETRDLGVTFNPYVRARDDGALEVWLLPAWQQDGTAVYGAELTYTFSADGKELLDRREIPGPMRGIRPDPEVDFHLDNRAHPCPTVGSLFFLMQHRTGFASITIHSDGANTVLAETEDGQLAWIHAVTDEEEAPDAGADPRPDAEPAAEPPPG
jgi:hypothetical protein